MTFMHAPNKKSNHDATFNAIESLAEDLHELSKKALQTYDPIVEQIIPWLKKS